MRFLSISVILHEQQINFISYSIVWHSCLFLITLISSNRLSTPRMLLAPHSKLCSRTFLIFVKSAVTVLPVFSKFKLIWPICYLLRTSMNFAHLASFHAKEFVDRPIPKTLEIIYCGPTTNSVCICMWDERIRQESLQSRLHNWITPSADLAVMHP